LPGAQVPSPPRASPRRATAAATRAPGACNAWQRIALFMEISRQERIAKALPVG
jgi:hypothetical protein